MHPYLHVFGLSIPSFGVMMLLGILAAFALLYATRRRVPFTEDDLLTMAIYAIIGGFVGAKVLYWIVELDRIVADPHFILESLTSGFVFYGALIVGALAIWLFARRRRQPFLGYLDLVAPSFILAQGFGRIGCFLAGCCYGAPCDSPLSVVYPEGVSAPAGVPLLPTQLFEAAFCFLYTAVLVCIFFRQKRYGTTTGWYFVGYGVWRFIIEFFRSDDRGAVGALSTSQFIGIFIVLAGAALLLVRRGKTPAHIPPQPGADAADTDAGPECPAEPQPKDAAAEAARDDGGPEPGSSAVDVDAGPERPDDAPEQDAPPCG